MSRRTINALMVTPFHSVQRGNSLTASRIREGLERRGIVFKTVSLEAPDWETRLGEALKGGRFDLVHGFHGVYLGKMLGLYSALEQIPLLLTMTGTDLNLRLGDTERKALDAAVSAASRVVVFNDDSRYRLLSRYAGMAGKVFSIPQGVYLEDGREMTRADLGLREDEVLFVLPSGLRWVKNIELAISGTERARASNRQIRLLIVGAAIEKTYSENILQRLRDLPWACYLGEVPHSWMKGLLRVSDVVLNTSRSEGQPQGALEAMSLGKPAILTLAPGNRGVIRHGVEGFYVRDVEDLEAAAVNLAAAKRLRDLMGDQARAMVARRFSLEREIDAYAALYHELSFLRP
ncbi:MAG: glycosyltransferase family 4 protein [Firmicutes bacterium]|nr:glycosyltransferase family 4 protein [Bacillota bacterium]